MNSRFMGTSSFGVLISGFASFAALWAGSIKADSSPIPSFFSLNRDVPAVNLPGSHVASEQTLPFLNQRPQKPQALPTQNLEVPISGLSGLHQVRNNPKAFYAVADRSVTPSRIFTITLKGSKATVSRTVTVTKNGTPMSYDLEGITLNPSGGFWLVSEGDGAGVPNLLLKVNGKGEVEEEIQLPSNPTAKISSFGLHGITTNADGTKIYAIAQREFENDPKNLVRIGEYDVNTQRWVFYLYPLDTDNDAGWVGLNEIVRDKDGSFLVLESDNQDSSEARVKRVYRVSLDGIQPGRFLQRKTLVTDLIADRNWRDEKAEALAVTDQGYWVGSDNQGSESLARLLFVPR